MRCAPVPFRVKKSLSDNNWMLAMSASPPVFDTVQAIRAWSRQHRQAGRRVGFVPTMGYLHEGHLGLVAHAREQTDAVAVSIFVNPTQFSPGEDLQAYPRDLERDMDLCRSAGVKALFVPSAAEMYPPDFQTRIVVDKVSQGLCGARRPGHFEGVATVVCKLFGAVEPSFAVFGEKDYQQLAVIRALVRDLNLGVDIQGVPTVRASDGLALSSRNKYLTADERARAASLFEALNAARASCHAGTHAVEELRHVARSVLEPAVDRIDYLEVRDAQTLEPVTEISQPAVMLVAAYLGAARLIDNMRVF